MKLSVIMSVYNGERYLAEAIDSILGQTLRDFEFLIVNDGSTDRSGEILANFARRDARIRIVEHPQNLGLTASLNGLLGEVKGEYLARMDADDVCLPERFAKQVNWLTGHPACGLVGSAYQFVDMAGRKGMTFHFENDHHFLRWYLCFQNPLAHPSAMGRTDLFRTVGGYREQFRYGQDFDLWWRLSFVTQLACLPEPLVCVRQNPAGVSGIHQAEQLAAKEKILVELLPRLGIKNAGDLLCHTDASMMGGLAHAKYIRAVYAGYMTSESLSDPVRKLIEQDVANRLGMFFMRHPIDGAGALLDALKMDPAVPFRASAAGFRRLVTKNVWNPIRR